MCKVLIHRVIDSKPVKKGKTEDGRPWELHVFECEVSVDGSGARAIRTVKTFEADLANQPMVGKTFEATKEGTAPPFKFMLVKPPKRRSGQRGASVRSNRQVAFEAANRLVSAALQTGCYESPDDAAAATVGIAATYLGFLEGGTQ